MSTGPVHTVRLSGDYTLRNVAELAQGLAEALAAHGQVLVDGRDVETIDFAAIQVLVSAHKTAQAEGKPFGVFAPAAGALAQTLRRAGFLDAAGRPTSTQGQFWLDDSFFSNGKAA